MADITQRLAKAKRFVASARTLRRHDPESAVSRAYYAVYHACVALLLARVYQTLDDEAIRAKDHREILADANHYFQAEMDAQRVRREYGASFLGSVRASNAARSDADYGLARIDEADARAEIAFAERVLRAAMEIIYEGQSRKRQSRQRLPR